MNDSQPIASLGKNIADYPMLPNIIPIGLTFLLPMLVTSEAKEMKIRIEWKKVLLQSKLNMCII